MGPNGDNSSSSGTQPLTWGEARSRLREILEKYLDDPPPPVIERQCASSDDKNDNNDDLAAVANRSLLSRWIIRHDLDLYAGSLALSVALLILACFSLTARVGVLRRSSLDPQADTSIYRAQVAAGVLLVIGSAMGIFVVRRRRFLIMNDSNNAKRREIRRFLRHKLPLLPTNVDDDDNDVNHAATLPLPRPAPDRHLVSQKGVYPVYRRIDDNTALWSRIPSLLLVEGDWLALQIGDIAPAHCTLSVDCSISRSDHQTPTSAARQQQQRRTIHLQAGEILTTDTFPSHGSSCTFASSLPKGRTTLSHDEPHLLTLCHNVQIFTVQSTPVEGFLRTSSVVGQSSQTSRQINALRTSMYMLAIFFLALAALIAFSRGYETDWTLIVTLPLLAALGVLPVVGPAFLFALEVLGTSRILATIHPYASSTNTESEGKLFPKTRLLFRYIVATSLSRLSLGSLYDSVMWLLCAGRLGGQSSSKQQRSHHSQLVRVPPASVNLLEKLGVATAFAIVDDELVCEPQSIPQQLLIPSGKGSKLLDLCQTYDTGETDSESDDETATSVNKRQRGKSFDSDSESDDGQQQDFHNTLRSKILPRRIRKRRAKFKLQNVRMLQDKSGDTTVGEEPSRFDVQFEDPNWWQFLPSLKCIGLAALLLDEKTDSLDGETNETNPVDSTTQRLNRVSASEALVDLVCSERESRQLRSLAECIGFKTAENLSGERGDLSPFTERLRLHVLSNKLFRERLTLDFHERSSEQSRWWGLLRPDATSVVVQDSRTKAFQLLTVGDPSVVISCCNEAWQGEISTILPLASADRQTIIETTNNWKLADLDVAAFSYTPVPWTLENRLAVDPSSHLYLLDNSEQNIPLIKDKTVSEEWTFIKNQVFLGVLGSLVVPRRESQNLVDLLSDAGVRFVYFSPRNMRRQKELAMQMGIDVAWNCAISLRPLEDGMQDQHRMQSTYADWDVNAKLPHGVEDVRKHLEEVDNVPLLVSLFTDVTKYTTKEMIEIFQQYHDTVIVVGLSHLTRNEKIFSIADVSVGIDTLGETIDEESTEKDSSWASVLPSELEFVASISAHSCAFRFKGASSLSYIPAIIEKGRVSLEASISASSFLTVGSVSYSLYVLFTVCSPMTVVPFVPTLGSVVYLQFLLPCLGFSMAMTDGDKDTMKRVPPKNDKKIAFGKKEGYMFYFMGFLKALLPALLPQILHLITFGELFLRFEPDLAELMCPGANSWVDIVRCGGLKDYSGKARTASGSLVFAQFVLCIIVSSAGFVQRLLSFEEGGPWSNRAWLFAIFFTFAAIVVFDLLSTENGTASALPWYFYVIALTTPFLCALGVELCKRREIKLERRAEKLRRLQFETRLGAWSPR